MAPMDQDDVLKTGEEPGATTSSTSGTALCNETNSSTMVVEAQACGDSGDQECQKTINKTPQNSRSDVYFLRIAELEAEMNLLEFKKARVRTEIDLVRRKLSEEIAFAEDSVCETGAVPENSDWATSMQDQLFFQKMETEEQPKTTRRGPLEEDCEDVPFDKTEPKMRTITPSERKAAITLLAEALCNVVEKHMRTEQPNSSGEQDETTASGEALESTDCSDTLTSCPAAIHAENIKKRKLVDSALRDLIMLPPPENSAAKLRIFADKLEKIVSTLQYASPSCLYSLTLTLGLLTKLNSDEKFRWYEFATGRNTEQEPLVVLFSKFMSREADRVCPCP